MFKNLPLYEFELKHLNNIKNITIVIKLLCYFYVSMNLLY